MQKIGFLGGTFNPIHNGHIRIALEAYEALELDLVHFVPSFMPVHKSSKDVLDFEIRVDLIKHAIQELELDDIFEVSEHESSLESGSYTYYSLQKWQELHKVKPYFIVGIEDFIKLDSWHNGYELPKFSHFIVVKRASLSSKEFEESIVKFWNGDAKKIADNSYEVYGSTISYFETTRLDISATDIRNASIQGKSLCCLVPRVVEEFILLNNEEVTDIWQGE